MKLIVDALAKNLSKNNFKYLSQEFTDEQLKLVKQNGACSYKYMDSFEKFSKDNLPDRCKFYISLKDECTNEKDYLDAINVCNVFNMKTPGDYHDLRLNRDVLLLANVLEKFISTCLEHYKLDSCNNFSSSTLSCDAVLKMTGIGLVVQILTCIYLLKKEWEKAFLTLTKDSVKQIINTCNQMMFINQANLLCI